jgi:hypothetical protein
MWPAPRKTGLAVRTVNPLHQPLQQEPTMICLPFALMAAVVLVALIVQRGLL